MLVERPAYERAVEIAARVADGIKVGPAQEAGKPGPLWRVDFDDAEKTSFYLSPETGEVVSVSGVLQLGRNEVGFVGPDGRPERAMQLPRFIEFDRMPLPATRQFGVRSLLSGAGLGEDQVCR